MRRREFIVLLGSAAAGWPLAARAQQTRNLATIGYVGTSTPLAESQRVAVFLRRLRELGWIEGRNLAIEFRWAEGRTERFAEIATAFVALKVDVIVLAGTAATLAVKRATPVIPIVFTLGGDPVGTGLVASLARPGGNVTGLSSMTSDLAGKRLDLLREVVPNLHRLGIITNADNPSTAQEMRDVERIAQTLGFESIAIGIRRSEDISPAFDALKGHADALYVTADPLVNTNRSQINTFAVSARLPTMHGNRENVETGGLMYYGPQFLDLFRRAADFVDKILRGTKPADIPVEQPTRFELIVNLTTAKILGLTVPPSLLAIADEVIE